MLNNSGDSKMTVFNSSELCDINIDKVVPKEKWEFDGAVADCFDNMLSRSIPLYDQMRTLCYKIGRRFITEESAIMDLGASRGEALRPFIEDNTAKSFIAIEIAEPMRKVLIELYGNNDKFVLADIPSSDLRSFDSANYKGQHTNLILSILTLQFTPIEYRMHIIQAIYDSLEVGGAFLFVEKVLGTSPVIDKILVDNYYEFKNANGYSYDDIQRKKASLEGVLVPVTASWNEDILKGAGFKHVDCFYRHLNFCGWIAIK